VKGRPLTGQKRSPTRRRKIAERRPRNEVRRPSRERSRRVVPDAKPKPTAPPAIIEDMTHRDTQGEIRSTEATVAEAKAPTPQTATREAPLLPIRHTVLFPFAILPLSIGRKRSLQLLNEVMTSDRTIAVFTQRDPAVEDPAVSDLNSIGTLATVLRMVRLPDERLSILVQGTSRVRLEATVKREPYLVARLTPLVDDEVKDLESEALAQRVVNEFERLVTTSQSLPMEAVAAARDQSSPGRLADFMASLLEMGTPDKQRLLETLDVKDRLQALHAIIVHQRQVLEVGQQIQDSVKETLDQRQREFMLRQQLEAIHRELGEGDDAQRAVSELKEKIEKAKMPAEVQREAERELARLGRMPVQAAEYTVARTYLEWLCDMPWAVVTEDQLDLPHVRKVLDEDHYGLEKIKERILEYLAVRRFKSDARTPILCFVGPPGTGKTSLGMSIARAIGRKFVRQSLGGVRDEAEIRGHRRTYIGALPGSILRGIRRAGSRNPLFMLDEIDKLASDFHGDPASAMLEVLDPEQNHAFLDHYLDVPFDLSQVMFVTTANYLDPVPPALRDRMEWIELSGYTDREKLAIAKLHLIPKTIRENGLESLGVALTDEAIFKLIRSYTSEAGLRGLTREIANLLRRTAKQVAEGQDPPRTIDPDRVRELLGPERFQEEPLARIETPGTAVGLAWTPHGGEVLTVEATLMPGSKGLMLTGQLGEIMRESAQAALSFVRTNAMALNIDPQFFDNSDIHIHLPAGAIAKDGPSAGVTLCTALVSVLTGRRMRPGISMTGEITLHGRVLPVGGLKEKILAAQRVGIKTVILPSENQKDLEEVPVEVRSQLIFAPVDRMDQVLALALESPSEDGGPAPVEPAGQESEPAEPSGGASSIESESVVARGRAAE
jgi:ATP-dependent Lon protease